MKITALVENTSQSELKARHGLSLYMETRRHKLLFDVGPDATLFENAEKLGIDLAEIDTVIISHGHMDHGGALGRFLKINPKAKVYIQRTAFEFHSYKVLFLKFPVGLDKALASHPQVTLLDGDYQIDEELSLFTVTETLLNEIALALKSYKDTRFYTCHCTGEKVFQHLKRQIPNLNYLSCGETIHI